MDRCRTPRATPTLEDFYRTRFREEFKPAFDAWLASDPLHDARGTVDAVRTSPSTSSPPLRRPTRLEAEAAAATEQAKVDIQRADNYVLAVVLFAASLFFAGISTRLRLPAARAVILGLGCLLFLGTVAWIATFPVSLEV